MANDFVIKISTQADTTGAQQTQAAMDAISQKATQLAGSAAQAGVETERFTDAAGKLREANGRFVATGNSVDEVRKHLSEASHEADHFASSLQAGISIDLGHRLVESIAEVPAKFREIIEEGVRFNAQMETLAVGLAGAFRASDPDRFGNFHEAQVAGTAALSAIQEKAIELGLDIHSLGEGLSINMNALAEGGIRDIKQQIDLISTLNQAAQAKGLDGARAQRDIVDLLQGRANRTLFGAELGISDNDVKAAREAGKLYEFLNEKLAAYKEGGQAAANTFAAAEQRLKTETEVLYGEISKPVFEALKEALTEINELLKDGKVADELKAMGHDVAEVARDGATLLKWGIELAPILFRVAEGVGAVSLAIALLKLPSLIASMARKTIEWVKSSAAIDTETAALKRNTAETERNNLAKETAPATRVAGAGAAVAEEGAAAGGALKYAGVGFAGAGAAIGTGMVALEAGYALIKLWESAKDQQIDALHEQSEVGSAALVAAQKQVDAADNAAKKEEARLTITKQIADLQAKIAENQPQQIGLNWKTGHPIMEGGDSDQVTILTEQLHSAQHELSKLEDNAGKHLYDKADNERGQKVLDAYHNTNEYKLEQAKLSGNQKDIDAYGYLVEVDKIREKLEPLHLPEAIAQGEAEAKALGDDLAKQRRSLDAVVDRAVNRSDKERDSASLGKEAAGREAGLFSALPTVQKGDLAAAGEAVKAMPEQTQQEISTKEYLATLLRQIIDLRKEEAEAKKREDAITQQAANEARSAADLKKQHDDTLAGEREEVEILRARASGHEDEARKMERKRDIQHEITRLMKEGASYAEAESIATDKVNLTHDAAEARAAERGIRREEPREHEHRRGDRETFTIHGYNDPDKGGGLHTGHLSTGGLSSGTSGDRFGGRPDAAAARLAKDASDPEHDPAARLARASSRVPTFPPAPSKPLFAPGADPIAQLFAGGPLASVFGAPAATVGFGPALSSLGPVGSPSSVPGPVGGDSGHAGVTKAAQDTSRAARDNTSATRELSSALSDLYHEMVEQRRETDEAKKKHRWLWIRSGTSEAEPTDTTPRTRFAGPSRARARPENSKDRTGVSSLGASGGRRRRLSRKQP